VVAVVIKSDSDTVAGGSGCARETFCGEAASEIIQLDSFLRPAQLFALAFGTEVRAGTHSRLRRLQKRRQAEVFEVSVRAWKKRRHNSDKIFHSLIESLLSRNGCTLTGTTDVVILPHMHRSICF